MWCALVNQILRILDHLGRSLAGGLDRYDFICIALYDLDTPDKLTQFGRTKLTHFGRSKLTRSGRSKLTHPVGILF